MLKLFNSLMLVCLLSSTVVLAQDGNNTVIWSSQGTGSKTSSNIAQSNVEKGEITINEIKINPPYGRAKTFSQKKQFIEFYNASYKTINLSPLYLSTDRNDLEDVQLRGRYRTNVKPGEFKVYKINFPFYAPRLVYLPERKGMTVYLSTRRNGEMVIVDSISVPYLKKHESYGLGDSTENEVLSAVTPGAANFTGQGNKIMYAKHWEFGIGPLLNTIDGKQNVEEGTIPRAGFGWSAKQIRFVGPAFWTMSFHYLRRGYTINHQVLEETHLGVLDRRSTGHQRYKTWVFGVEAGVNILPFMGVFVGQHMLINTQDIQFLNVEQTWIPNGGEPIVFDPETSEIKKDPSVQFSMDMGLRFQLLPHLALNTTYFLDQRGNLENTGKIRNHTFLGTLAFDLGYGWKQIAKQSLIRVNN